MSDIIGLQFITNFTLVVVILAFLLVAKVSRQLDKLETKIDSLLALPGHLFQRLWDLEKKLMIY